MAYSHLSRDSIDSLIEHEEYEEKRGLSKSSDYRPPNRRSWRSFPRDVAFLALCVIIVVLLSVIVYQQQSIPTCRVSSTVCQSKPHLDASIADGRTMEVRFVSAYAANNSDDMARVDKNWNNLSPVHGTVAVDKHWAAEKGLPLSDALATDPEKSVYVLEAYHSIHCLKVIRQTMFELARGKKLTVPFGHSTHCLAGLLEHVVCGADDTLLYWKDGVSTGDGQRRQCRNWNALQEWAGQHSACYVVDDLATQHEDPSHKFCTIDDGLILETV